MEALRQAVRRSNAAPENRLTLLDAGEREITGRPPGPWAAAVRNQTEAITRQYPELYLVRPGREGVFVFVPA